MFSLAHNCPLRTAMLRNAIGLSFDPPLLELLVPFPDTTVVLAFAFTLASTESLELRRGPESENNLPEIWNNIYFFKKKDSEK